MPRRPICALPNFVNDIYRDAGTGRRITAAWTGTLPSADMGEGRPEPRSNSEDPGEHQPEEHEKQKEAWDHELQLANQAFARCERKED